MNRLFFGYASKPEFTRSTIKETSERCGDLPNIESSVSWEDLLVDGKLIVEEVEASIASSSISLFDLTTLNHNVLFETGLAIGSDKRVLLLLDEQDKSARSGWDSLSLLKTTGFTGYKNADDLVSRIASAVATPTDSTLLHDLLQGYEATIDPQKILYVPSVKQDDASNALSRELDKHPKFNIDQLDLDDYGTAPLAWYVQQIYSAQICVVHLAPERAYLAELMNPRAALLAGIAKGLKRTVLVVSEEAEPTALDYRDISIRYANPKQLERRVAEWIERLPEQHAETGSSVRRYVSVELASMRFGNHVAEADSTGLERYFVPTSDFESVISADSVIFTGRKGTGKTANMIQAAEQLRADARNSVCVIKPASYELAALVELLQSVSSAHLTEFIFEAFWKYILYTEVAVQAVQDGEARPAGIAHDSELAHLRDVLAKNSIGPESSLSSRLEGLLDSLRSLLEEGFEGGGIEKNRGRISSALYGGPLREIRDALAAALADKKRIAVLVDNLDKAWERGADLALLSKLVLGLLSVIGRVEDEFRKASKGHQSAPMTLTVFLRSDIFAYVRDRAREPDKITTSEIEWRNQDLLARVLEERFMALRGAESQPEHLWTKYFKFAKNEPHPKQYILSRVQPRPRDLVFFGNACVTRAADAKHGQITFEDVKHAEREYSQFAYEALLVEGMASDLDLEKAMIGLAGEPSILGEALLNQVLGNSFKPEEIPPIVKTLRRLGFLGKEIGVDRFDYGGTESEISRADVLATKLSKSAKREVQYEIHSAYRMYLEISEA